MKKSYAILTFILLLFLLQSIAFSQEKLRKEGNYYIAEIEKEFKVKKGGSLIMEQVQGDVNITTWNKNVVKILEIRKMDVYTKEEAEAVFKEAKSVYRQEDNTIRIGAEESYRSYMSSRFKINLPVEFNVDIGTRGGDISVADLKGTADLKTSGGDIDLIRIDGKVDAKTSGGDVKITKNTKEVTVKTSGGDIEIIDVEGEVNAKTSGGDVIIKNNKAKVNAKTSGGDIELVNVGAEVQAHTSGGDVEVDGSAGDISVAT